jgi:hypothetical protein
MEFVKKIAKKIANHVMNLVQSVISDISIISKDARNVHYHVKLVSHYMINALLA